MVVKIVQGLAGRSMFEGTTQQSKPQSDQVQASTTPVLARAASTEAAIVQFSGSKSGSVEKPLTYSQAKVKSEEVSEKIKKNKGEASSAHELSSDSGKTLSSL